MAHIIAVLNQKGGVGKTTTTINLAAYLAKFGKTVLIVDSDPQGNATSGLGFEKQNDATTYQVLLGLVSPEDATLETAFAGVALMPANTNLAAAEIELMDQSDKENRLKKALVGLQYDYILIDCPPALSLLTVDALVAANWLLVPVQAEYYAMEGLGQLMEVFQRVKQTMNPNLNLLGVLVTMYDKRTSLAEQVVTELQKYFGETVFKTHIPRNVRLAEAPSHGKPISEHDKWSKGARAYKQFSKEVMNRAS
ncbi:MAG: ParA family protein [Patescibacteria group bacterium]